MKDFIEDYLAYLVFEKGLSNKTKESYRNDLEIYRKYLEDNSIVSPSNIDEDIVKDFIKSRKKSYLNSITNIDSSYFWFILFFNSPDGIGFELFIKSL